MALRKSRPLKWVPRGLSDSIDGSNTFSGAMKQLINLVPDPRAAGVFTCRPAAEEYEFDAGAPPADAEINSLYVIGGYAYFMAEGTGATQTHDIPYAYDLENEVFVSISGITVANTPVTPLASGDWEPPTMELIGTQLTVTHPGFDTGAGYYVGWLDISNPLAPAWSAGNTATNGFAARPVAVARSRDGRAYYAVNNSIEASDVADPTTRTNSGQVLTIGDSDPLVALGELALGNITAGGIVQAVICFKDIQHDGGSMFQVTGDYNSSWAVNQMNVNTSTIAPLSAVQTHLGLAFLSPEGLRLVDMQGMVSDPIGIDGDGISTPFIYAEEPTRIVGASNGNTMRFSVKNGNAGGAPWQEYWFTFSRKCWSGPHTFPAAMIVAYGHDFVMAPQDSRAKLFNSHPFPHADSTYVENGEQMSWAYQTVLLPDNDMIAMNSMVENNIMIALPYGSTATVLAQDEDGNQIGLATLVSDASVPVNWDAFNWDEANWAGAAGSLKQKRIDFSAPLVFKQMTEQINGNSMAGISIGNLYLRYQTLGYDLPYAAAS